MFYFFTMFTMWSIETGSWDHDGLHKLNMIWVTENSGKNLNGMLSCLSQNDIDFYLDRLKDSESSSDDIIFAIQQLKSDQNGSKQVDQLIISIEPENKTELINKLISYIKNSNNSIKNMIIAIQTLNSDPDGAKELEKELKIFLWLKDEYCEKLKSDLCIWEKKRQEKEKIRRLKYENAEIKNNKLIVMTTKTNLMGDKSPHSKNILKKADELVAYYDNEYKKNNEEMLKIEKIESLGKIKDEIKKLEDSIATYEAKSQLLCELFSLEKLRLEGKKDKDQQAYNDFVNSFITDFKDLKCKKDLDIISNWPKNFKYDYENILKELGWEHFGEYQKKIDSIKNEIKKNMELEFIILPDSGIDNLNEEEKKEIDSICDKMFDITENSSKFKIFNEIKQCNNCTWIKEYMDAHDIVRKEKDMTNFIDLFWGVLWLGSNYGFWTQQDKNWYMNSNRVLEERRFDAIKTFLLIKGIEPIKEKEIEKYILKRVFFSDEEYANNDDKKKIAKYCLERELNNFEIIKLDDFNLNDFIDKFYKEINTIFKKWEKPDIMNILKLAVKNAKNSKDWEKLLNILTIPFCTVNDTPFKYYFDLDNINKCDIENWKKGKFIELNKDDFIDYISKYSNSESNIYTFLWGVIWQSFKESDANRFYERCTNGEVIRVNWTARLIIKYIDGKPYIRHYVSPSEHWEEWHGKMYQEWLDAEYWIKCGQTIV